jgi:hypothetical protein
LRICTRLTVNLTTGSTDSGAAHTRAVPFFSGRMACVAMSKESDHTSTELTLEQMSGHASTLEVKITDALNSHLIPLSNDLQPIDLDKIALNALLTIMLRILKHRAASSDYHRAFIQTASEQLLNVKSEAEGGYPAHEAPPLITESTTDGLMEQISGTIRLFLSEHVKGHDRDGDISQDVVSALVGCLGVTVRNINSAEERQRLMRQIEGAVEYMPELIEETRADLGLDEPPSDKQAVHCPAWPDDH